MGDAGQDAAWLKQARQPIIMHAPETDLSPDGSSIPQPTAAAGRPDSAQAQPAAKTPAAVTDRSGRKQHAHQRQSGQAKAAAKGRGPAGGSRGSRKTGHQSGGIDEAQRLALAALRAKRARAEGPEAARSDMLSDDGEHLPSFIQRIKGKLTCMCPLRGTVLHVWCRRHDRTGRLLKLMCLLV